MKPLGEKPYLQNTRIEDLEDGIYGFNSSYLPQGDVPIQFGMIIVFKSYHAATGGYPKTILAIGKDGFFYRTKWADKWTNWVTI